MSSETARPVFAVCWKAVQLRARVDPLSGAVMPDPASLAASPADQAALEWALRCAERFGGSIRLVSVGGAAAEVVLRQGAPVGVPDVVRVDAPDDLPSESVAELLAGVVGDAALVWCGDVSHDRGSGAVPAYLADHLGAVQALGLVSIQLPEVEAGARTDARDVGEIVVRATRRLDGGRRELLEVGAPAVLSCEGGTARLRRASLGAVLAARRCQVRVVDGDGAVSAAAAAAGEAVRLMSVAPFRPRARVVPAPSGSSPAGRIRQLTGVATEPRTARALTLEPDEAAAVIVEALESWGELP